MQRNIFLTFKNDAPLILVILNHRPTDINIAWFGKLSSTIIHWYRLLSLLFCCQINNAHQLIKSPYSGWNFFICFRFDFNSKIVTVGQNCVQLYKPRAHQMIKCFFCLSFVKCLLYLYWLKEPQVWNQYSFFF